MKTILRHTSLFILLLSFALPLKAQNRHHHRDNDYNLYQIDLEKRELREMKDLSYHFEKAIMNRRFHRAHSIKLEIASLMQQDLANTRAQLQDVNHEIERLKRKTNKHYHKRNNHHYKNRRGHGPHNGYYNGRNGSNRLYVALEAAKNLKWELKDLLMHKREILHSFKHSERNKRFSLKNDRMELHQYIHQMRQDLNLGSNQYAYH